MSTRVPLRGRARNSHALGLLSGGGYSREHYRRFVVTICVLVGASSGRTAPMKLAAHCVQVWVGFLSSIPARGVPQSLKNSPFCSSSSDINTSLNLGICAICTAGVCETAPQILVP